MKKFVAEFIGTFWLVLGGCGSAVLACNFPDGGFVVDDEDAFLHWRTVSSGGVACK